MPGAKRLEASFVTDIPETLRAGVLYVSMEYATALHRCCCGCGAEVVTPLSPTGWELTYDGVGVTLHPSIGNWSVPCQSHYWIRRGAIIWDRRWSVVEIARYRSRQAEAPISATAQDPSPVSRTSQWARLRRWWGQ